MDILGASRRDRDRSKAMKATSNLVKQKRELSKLWLRYRVPATAAVVLALVLGGGNTLWESFREGDEAAHETERAELVGGFSKRLGNPVSAQTKAVAALSSDTELAQLFAGADAASLARANKDLAARLPGNLGVRLIPHGVRKVDYDHGIPPISYGTLDVIRQSLRDKRDSPAQVHLVARPEEHIALLRRVAIDDQEIGHLLVAYPASLLSEAVKQPSADSLYVELIQSVPGGRPVAFGKAGDVSLKSGVGEIVHIRGTSWRLVFWLPPSTSAQLDVLSDLIPIFAAAGVLLLVAGVAVVLAIGRKRRAAKRVMLGGAVSIVSIPDAAPEGALARRDFGFVEGGAPQAPASMEFLVPQPESSLDLDFDEDDYDSSAPLPEVEHQGAPEPESALEAAIFRAYDIRGIVGAGLDADVVREIGRAIGTEAYERGQQTIVVARDGRTSADELRDALVEGLLATGRDVIDIGRVPTPVLYFATYFLDTGSGVMVTGSHNPAQYNGLKIMLGGDTLFGDAIQSLRQRTQTGNFHTGQGELRQMDLLADYIRRISEDIPVALGNAFKIVIDCGNGVAGDVAPKLIQALGHDVVELYCDIDGTFPNHAPDPTQPENLQDLISTVREHKADLGLAFDGDGDRVGVVDGAGNIIWADRLMMLYARDILTRHPGASIVYDVKCTRLLREEIEANGGVAIMDKTGHSFMKNKLQETPEAQLAGELSGHIFFKERWYGFDDGMYAATRLLEILMAAGRSAEAVFAELPAGESTPELHIHLTEGEPFAVMQAILADPDVPGATVSTIDGLRAEFADGWGLVRASNTTPSLICRFEGDDAPALERVKTVFRDKLAAVRPGLDLPF